MRTWREGEREQHPWAASRARPSWALNPQPLGSQDAALARARLRFHGSRKGLGVATRGGEGGQRGRVPAAGGDSPRGGPLVRTRVPRSSEEQLSRAYHLLTAQLRQEHAEVRLSAFQVAEELFARSHLFRLLVVSDFQGFLELTLGTDPRQPLPPPREAAQRLRQAAARAVQGWSEKFGAAYKKLALGYHFLRHSQQVRGPRLVDSRARDPRRLGQGWGPSRPESGQQVGGAALGGSRKLPRVRGVEPVAPVSTGGQGKEGQRELFSDKPPPSDPHTLWRLSRVLRWWARPRPSRRRPSLLMERRGLSASVGRCCRPGSARG